MGIDIVTGLPIWLVIFCVGLGVAYSWFLYRKDKALAELSVWLVRFLATFRFLVVFILSFLLLNPMIRHTVKEVEKPLIFIACDNSSSVISLPDSNYYKTELPVKLGELRTQLADQFETVFYTFGSSLKKAETPDYSEKTTDISSVFSEFTKIYGSPKSGAIIIAT
ncbi:MAG: hypothetical protein KKD31_14900, partial [Bacteroidetes bacterium]|nr:hypothetical protein [Bacteroidota bacterium]